MPALDEGTLMYMPTTLPGISIHQGGRTAADAGPHHQVVPRGGEVFGKAGRAQTATDPAPTEMFETIINLKPKSQLAAGSHRRQP